jgi:hypothetical protein
MLRDKDKDGINNYFNKDEKIIIMKINKNSKIKVFVFIKR